MDGASSIDGRGNFGVGVIICDEAGGVVATLCKALPSHYLAECIEFFTLEHSVLLAQELNLSHVNFESDATSVISAISQGHYGGSMGHLVQSI